MNWREYGIYDGYALLVWKNTREMNFSLLKTTFQFTNGVFPSSMAKSSNGLDAIDLALDLGFRSKRFLFDELPF